MKKNNIVTIYNAIIDVLLIAFGILFFTLGDGVLEDLQNEALEGSGMGGALIFLIFAIVSLFFYVIGVLLILVSIISLIILGVNYFRHKKTTKGVFIYQIVIFSILLFNVFTFFPPLILESGFNIIAFLLMLPFAAIFILGIVLNSYAISKLNKEKEKIVQEN